MKTRTIANSIAAGFILFSGAAFAAAQPGGWKGTDSDGDGNITEAELDAQKEKLLSEADADGDGTLTREERRAYRQQKRQERRAERNPDKDGDGVVSYAEYQTAAEERFKRLDKNNDGVLSEDERRKPGKRGKKGRGKK